jgi:hypothetical protein
LPISCSPDGDARSRCAPRLERLISCPRTGVASARRAEAIPGISRSLKRFTMASRMAAPTNEITGPGGLKLFCLIAPKFLTCPKHHVMFRAGCAGLRQACSRRHSASSVRLRTQSTL